MRLNTARSALHEALAERDEYRVWMRKWRERCMAMSTVEAERDALQALLKDLAEAEAEAADPWDADSGVLERLREHR